MIEQHPRPGRPRSSAEPKYQVRALQRGLLILGSFSAAEPSLTLAQLSERLAIPKPTTLRLLECLRGEGFVAYHADSGRYSLGLRAFEIGSVYLAGSRLEQTAGPFLRRLMLQTNQTANLGVLDHDQVLHLAVFEPDRPLRYHSRVGARDFVHCTALGKVLAAHLDDDALRSVLAQAGMPARTRNTHTDPTAFRAELAEVRARGYAEDREESAAGLRCLAAPVRSPAGEIVAAVSISGPAAEFDGTNGELLLTHVLAAARELSRRVGWSAGRTETREVTLSTAQPTQ